MTETLDDSAVLNLVERIYEAAADPGQWTGFTQSLHQHLPFASISALLVDMSGRLAPQAINAGLPDASIRSYVEHYYKINAYAPAIGAASAGAIVSCAEVHPREQLKKHAYYNEWLRPAGNLTSGACLIVEKSALHSMQVSIDLPERYEHLESSSARLLARLHPHLSRAIKLNGLLRGEAALLSTIDGLLQSINAAAFVLDAAGNSTHQNAAAEDMLRQGQVRSDHLGRLRLHRAADQERLETAIAAAGGGPHTESGLPFVMLGSKGTELIVTVLPLRPRSPGFVVNAARVLVVIKPKQSDMALSTASLRSVHGLTTREAQVAALVASGAHLEQIAEMLGVSAITARNQLASAMGKLGTPRQVELVALLAQMRTTVGPT